MARAQKEYAKLEPYINIYSSPIATAHADLERKVEDLREIVQAVSWLADPEKAERIMRGLKLLEKLEKRRKQRLDARALAFCLFKKELPGYLSRKKES